MTIARIETSKRLSQAVIHGDIVYVAGQVARDKPEGNVSEQTKNILERIESLLAQAGTDKSKLITAQIWISDIRFFDEMNKVWDEWVVPNEAPTRACVESLLAAPHFFVEISVTAALDERT